MTDLQHLSVKHYIIMLGLALFFAVLLPLFVFCLSFLSVFWIDFNGNLAGSSDLDLANLQ